MMVMIGGIDKGFTEICEVIDYLHCALQWCNISYSVRYTFLNST